MNREREDNLHEFVGRLVNCLMNKTYEYPQHAFSYSTDEDTVYTPVGVVCEPN